MAVRRGRHPLESLKLFTFVSHDDQGLYFEDFHVGWEMASAARTVTADDIDSFAALSGDHNRLHTDPEFAKASRYRGRIAHGLLGLISASGLASTLGFLEGTVEAFLSLEWHFRHPLFVGDTMRIHARIGHLRRRPSQSKRAIRAARRMEPPHSSSSRFRPIVIIGMTIGSKSASRLPLPASHCSPRSPRAPWGVPPVAHRASAAPTRS
jgi:acyl dehydratase